MADVINITEGGGGRACFRCPGCNDVHCIAVGSGGGTRWSWNGSTERPTFAPSLLLTTGHFCSTHKPGDPCWCTYNAEHPEAPASFACAVCHSFVKDGQIQFLADCTHSLASQTVPLPPWERETLPAPQEQA